MSAFTQKENPVGRYLANGRDFLLLQNLVYHVGEEGSEEVIIVPEGSVTDWASIPEVIRPLLPNTYGKRAAVVHDYLYRTKGLGGLYDRKRCDEIFLEALKVLEVPWRIRQTLYSGVRIGGWVPWNKYEKEKQNELYENNDGRPDY
jgi:hypothetical protein